MATKDIQTLFLSMLKVSRNPVAIYLKNGIKLNGFIEDFNKYTITLASPTATQFVRKNAISTINEVVRYNHF